MEKLQRLYNTLKMQMTREHIHKVVGNNLTQHIFSGDQALLAQMAMPGVSYKELARVQGYWLHEDLMLMVTGSIMCDLTMFFLARIPIDMEDTDALNLQTEILDMMHDRANEAATNGLISSLAKRFGSSTCDVDACQKLMDQMHGRLNAIQVSMLVTADQVLEALKRH